jgi:hypothetical protein
MPLLENAYLAAGEQDRQSVKLLGRSHLAAVQRRSVELDQGHREYSPWRSRSPRATALSSAVMISAFAFLGAAWTSTQLKPPAVVQQANPSPFIAPSRVRMFHVQFMSLFSFTP